LILAHASDLHVLDLEGVAPWRYLNKRLTGLVSLALARKSAHPPHIAKRLVEDLLEIAPDHVLVTGDLTNLALEPEFARARTILEPLAERGILSVIPGNHDVYTRGAQRSSRFESFFGDLLWSDPMPAAHERYPWHRTVGDVHVIGFCSAVPRAPVMATGEISDHQLRRLTELAAAHDFDDAFVIALVHHNLHPRGSRKDAMHGLDNRDAFVAALGAAGVNMVLHGHTHVAHRFRINDMAIIGCGSSTWSSDDPSHIARYNLYEIEHGRLERITTRIFSLEEDRFMDAGPLDVP
jgi:3',5'-cyclic AMP phosphodiesterase CpdA